MFEKKIYLNENNKKKKLICSFLDVVLNNHCYVFLKVGRKIISQYLELFQQEKSDTAKLKTPARDKS